MLLVTGTRRSGTSMWMQAFVAAGHPVIGEPFPRDWLRVKHANPRGFYESSLREGINFTTNPDPATGVRLVPEETRNHVVKVFHQGLPLTERVWLDRVLVTVREWRTYCASVLNLEVLERESVGVGDRDPLRVDPVYEWLYENLITLQDVATRGYPIHFSAVHDILDDPARIGPIYDWATDPPVDPAARAAAIASVDPQLARRAAPTPAWVSPAHAEVLDRLYAAMREGDPLTELDTALALAAELARRPRAPSSVWRAGIEARTN